MNIIAQQMAPISIKPQQEMDEIEDIIDLGSSLETPIPEHELTIKDPPLSPIFIISLILGFFLLCLSILVFLKNRRRQISISQDVRLLPHEQAIQDLKLIWKQQESLDDKPFASSISDILRIYIESEFNIRAAEQTTEEFLLEAKQHPELKGQFTDNLQPFLNQVDLVKFARFPLSDDQRKTIFCAALNFVEDSHQNKLLKLDPELSSSARILTA